MKQFFFGLVFILFCCCLTNATESDNNSVNSTNDLREAETKLFEQGRTLVHNTVKRFMILLPAIFFKLGVAFTMLILIAIAAVNNGVIGFLLLVVGLSSVLARLQETRKSALTVPYISPLPPYHQHVWDRSDSGVETTNKPLYYNPSQTVAYSQGLNSYYGRYSNSKF